MYCPSCGREIADGSDFCKHCGAQIEPDTRTQQTESDEPIVESDTAAVESSGSETRAQQAATGESAESAAGSDRATVGSSDNETSPGRAAERQQTTGTEGLEPNVAGALSYLLGFVTGLIFFFIEQEDEFVRFHAAQSIVVFGGLFVLSIVVSLFSTFASLAVGGGFVFMLIGFLISLAWLAVGLGAFVLWVYLMYKAYQGETPRIPVAAGIADNLV